MLNCKLLANSVCSSVKLEITRISKISNNPCLAVILVGNNPASTIYVKNKLAKSQELGISCKQLNLESSITTEDLLALIKQLNSDNLVHAILVQMPLPKHIDAKKVINSIAPNKDVDGFSSFNFGMIMQANFDQAITPCTPKGILYIIDHCLQLDNLNTSKNKYAGKICVILGRSDIVGKPLAVILTNLGATVIVCNRNTINLNSLLALADILVVAIGSASSINLSSIKDQAIVIDVGINVIEDLSPLPDMNQNNHNSADKNTPIIDVVTPKRKISGDVAVDLENIIKKSLTVTSVPGGVGLMTVAMLMSNVLWCYNHQHTG